MTTLDRTDLRLLAVLQGAGRITNAELAERINLSPSACLRRLQRLEADKVILGYAARSDPQAVGLGLQAFVRVQLNRHESAAVESFVRQVNEWDEVTACHALRFLRVSPIGSAVAKSRQRLPRRWNRCVRSKRPWARSRANSTTMRGAPERP